MPIGIRYENIRKNLPITEQSHFCNFLFSKSFRKTYKVYLHDMKKNIFQEKKNRLFWFLANVSSEVYFFAQFEYWANGNIFFLWENRMTTAPN